VHISKNNVNNNVNTAHKSITNVEDIVNNNVVNNVADMTPRHRITGGCGKGFVNNVYMYIVIALLFYPQPVVAQTIRLLSHCDSVALVVMVLLNLAMIINYDFLGWCVIFTASVRYSLLVLVTKCCLFFTRYRSPIAHCFCAFFWGPLAVKAIKHIVVHSALNGWQGEVTGSDDLDEPRRMGRRERNRQFFGGSSRRGGNAFGPNFCPYEFRDVCRIPHCRREHRPRDPVDDHRPELGAPPEEPWGEHDTKVIEEVTIKGTPPLQPLVLLAERIAAEYNAHPAYHVRPEIGDLFRGVLMMILGGIAILCRFGAGIFAPTPVSPFDESIGWTLMPHSLTNTSVNPDHIIGYTHCRTAHIYPTLLFYFRKKVTQTRVTKYTYSTLLRNAMLHYSSGDQVIVADTVYFYINEVKRHEVLSSTLVDATPCGPPST